MKRVAFYTLGCKVNQYDAQAMREAFEAENYACVGFDEEADVYVVNTCTVTGTGDAKSRKTIRQVHREHPDAQIVVAGCLAQREAEKLLLPGVRLVLGTQARAQVARLLERAVQSGSVCCAVEGLEDATFEPLWVARHEGRTRATLKIQEGCDNRCAYCVIPSVRGASRSMPLPDLRAQAEALAGAGYAEVVLTGIHLGSYGRDVGSSLAQALRELCALEIPRIRLGSLEPGAIDDELIDLLRARRERVCAQFHLSLQSGSDGVLRRMRRRYSAEQYARAAEKLRGALPDCALTTDIIAGFPGETDAEHAETLAFARRVGLTRLHVFPFSPRQGTPAADMPGQVAESVKKRRVQALLALSSELHAAFVAARTGDTASVLFEEQWGKESVGYTPEYVRVRAPGEHAGQIRRVRLLAANGEEMFGECVPDARADAPGTQIP